MLSSFLLQGIKELPSIPFYLAINYGRRPGINIWYIGAPLGKNEIGKLMKTAAQSAGLQGNFNNHTVRKTCISRLMDAEVPVDNVPQLSGHRHLKSLNSYKAASADNQWKMSLILSRSGQESTQTSTISVHENTTLPAPSRSTLPVRKKKAQSPRSPRKEESSSAMIPILIS